MKKYNYNNKYYIIMITNYLQKKYIVEVWESGEIYINDNTNFP